MTKSDLRCCVSAMAASALQGLGRFLSIHVRNQPSNFKNIAGLFFITLSMAFAPPRRKALCSSAMVSALSALRARSGLPDSENLGCRRLLFERLGEFAPAGLLFQAQRGVRGGG